MQRRDFLRRLTATAAGLLVADDTLELLLEPPRKLWPGASFGDHGVSMMETMLPVQETLDELMRRIFEDTLVRNVVSDTELIGILASPDAKHAAGGRYIEASHLFVLPAPPRLA